MYGLYVYVNALMMTSWNGNIFGITGPFCVGNSLVTSEFPSQRPVTQSFDIFFEKMAEQMNKWLSKQSKRWWFEMPSHSLWRHCNVMKTLVWFLAATLQWRHMSGMMSQITSNWKIVKQLVPANKKKCQSTTLLVLCEGNPFDSRIPLM